jgi:hypothetical protein
MTDEAKRTGAPEGDITEAMTEAGAMEILGEVGGADLGGFFSAEELANKVYRAMERIRQKDRAR